MAYDQDSEVRPLSLGVADLSASTPLAPYLERGSKPTTEIFAIVEESFSILKRPAMSQFNHA